VWGERIADALRAEGAEPVIAPLVATVPVEDATLAAALVDLADGRYDWLVITSAAAVDALGDARPAPGTRVAAVGPSTAVALDAAGLPTDLIPEDHSAAGILAAWTATGGRVLILASDLADPALADGLRARGAQVDALVAYRTIPVDLDARIRRELADGGIDTVLVTSGSVARSLADQVPGLTATVACLGPRTAEESRAAGLDVRVVAPERSAEALVRELARALAEEVG
jgi:uroporphyrinogen-III synthase